MSSTSFNVIRKHSLDATGVRIKELTQALATARSKLEGSQLETDDVRSQGRMDHSTIKLNDQRLSFGTVINADNTDFFYEFPNEPDLDKLKVWIMLDHLGARVRDISGFQNDAYVSGHPTLRRAYLNLGFQQLDTSPATPVMLFNSGTDVVSQTDGEYIWVPDNESIQFTKFDDGFSIHFRFNCLNFAQHYTNDGGRYSRRFASKTDNIDTDGWSVLVYASSDTPNMGGIEFEIMDNGIEYARKTYGYSVGLWYQVVVTYDPKAGNTSAERIKIYTGGNENAVDSTFGTILSTTTNLRIGARSSGTGFFHGYIHDFRLYMGKVLTQEEVTNLNNNELTIDNIEKGHVFVVQYALIQQIIKSKKHKWLIVGRIVKTKVHKFNTIEQIVQNRVHKYSILQRVLPLRTHKYTIVELVQRLLTIVYDQGGLVTITKKHKYNIQNKITASKTHKYNIGMEGLQTQYKRFAKSTTAGSNITQEITYNYTPQAIIVWSDGSTADNAFSDQFATYYGFSDGTNHGCVSGISKDNLSDSDTFSGHKDNRVISLVDNTVRGMVAEATVSFSDSKAIFNWTTNDNRAVYIHTMAIWNAENIEVKNFTTGTSSTGNIQYSLNNSSMTPTTLLTLNHDNVSGWGDTSTSYAISMGAAISATKQFSVCNESEDAQGVTDVNTSYYTDHCLVAVDDDTGTIEYSAKLSSFGQGTFTLNYTNAPTSSTYKFTVLAINHPYVDIGMVTQPAGSTGTQVVNVDINENTPVCIMMFSNKQTSGTRIDDCHISIGAASSTADQGLIVSHDTDDVSTSVSARQNKTGSILKNITSAATASSSTTHAEAAVSAMNTADQFTLNWTTVADSTARKSHYIVFGSGSSSPPSSAPTITDRSPLPNATNVPVDANIVITFSEAMDPNYVGGTWFQLRKTSDMQTIISAAEVLNPNNVVTVNPSANMDSGTSYTMTVVGGASGVRDLEGYTLAANVSWSWTTA